MSTCSMTYFCLHTEVKTAATFWRSLRCCFDLPRCCMFNVVVACSMVGEGHRRLEDKTARENLVSNTVSITISLHFAYRDQFEHVLRSLKHDLQSWSSRPGRHGIAGPVVGQFKCPGVGGVMAMGSSHQPVQHCAERRAAQAYACPDRPSADRWVVHGNSY